MTKGGAGEERYIKQKTKMDDWERERTKNKKRSKRIEVRKRRDKDG